MIPDWQLPAGVDRGLWDYLHATDMVTGYDGQMRASPLARADVAFCERAFPAPGRLLDLGCGTGRLCAHFAAKGFECVGVDLSDEMLAQARARGEEPTPGPSLKGGEQELRNSGPSGESGEVPRAFTPPFREGPGVGSSTFLKANLVDLSELADRSFDYAACLFSTLGMVRGADNRAKVLANAFRLLRPGGRLVLHAHNRFFRGLGWKRVAAQRLKTLSGSTTAGDIAMPQAYGGAPLTLHHFTHGEVVALLERAGFEIRETKTIGWDGEDASGARVYGWLILTDRPLRDTRR